MRITFLDSFSSERETFVGHRTYDLPDEQARQLVKAKVARPAKDEERPQTADPNAK